MHFALGLKNHIEPDAALPETVFTTHGSESPRDVQPWRPWKVEGPGEAAARERCMGGSPRRSVGLDPTGHGPQFHRTQPCPSGPMEPCSVRAGGTRFPD